MKCKHCGKEMDGGLAYCPYCGQKLAGEAVEKRDNMCGFVGFILSVVSAVANILFFIPGAAALVLCIIGMVRRKSLDCNGYAKAGLVISIVFLLIWAALWIWASVILDYADQWA